MTKATHDEIIGETMFEVQLLCVLCAVLALLRYSLQETDMHVHSCIVLAANIDVCIQAAKWRLK